jgi:hypothetical protein
MGLTRMNQYTRDVEPPLTNYWNNYKLPPAKTCGASPNPERRLKSELEQMSYILILGTVLLGLFSLHKDWQNYKHPWLRKAVGGILLIVGAVSVIKQYRDNQDAQIMRIKAANDINTLKTELAGLQGQAKAANEAQTQNTKVFLEALNTTGS